MLRNTMQPLFWLRTNQTNKRGLAPLMLRLTVNGRRVETATSIHLTPDEWDATRQRVTGKSARLYNPRLIELQERALACFYDLDRQGLTITPTLLKNALLGKVTLAPTVVSCAADFIGTRTGNRAGATLLRYQRAAVMLATYLKARNRAALLISEVTPEVGRGFLAWVLAGGAGNAYAAKIVRFLSQVCEHAVREGHLTYNPLQFLEYPKQAAGAGGKPLTDAELARLEANIDVLPTRALQEAARCFVFACHTGLAYVDLAAVRRATHLQPGPGGLWLRGNRQKTGKAYRMPLAPTALRMLGEADRLPLASNPRYNYLLKIIADTLGLPGRLSSHYARATFVRLIGARPGLTAKDREILTGDTHKVLERHYAAFDEERVAAAVGHVAAPTLAEIGAKARAAKEREPWLLNSGEADWLNP